MNANRELLETQLGEYESQVKGLKSFVTELKARAAEHDTDKEHFEMDLIEAEHNIEYYEAAIRHLKDEIDGSGKSERPQTGADTILPRTTRQCIGSIIFSSISFVAGAILVSRLKSRPGTQEKKAER